MTDAEDINAAPENPADALADMAGGEDAEEARDVPLADEEDDSPHKLSDDALTPALDLAGGAASASRLARRANAHTYKKTMVPFLVVVAALLLLVGGITTAIVVKRGPDSEARLAETFVMLVSFPLAAILAFGAWWFHRDTRPR